MNTVFVITNQLGQFLNKHKEWVDGRDAKILYRSPHKDEALNLVFELSSKDIYLRAETAAVELDDKKQPVVEASDTPTGPTDDSSDLFQPGDSATAGDTESADLTETTATTSEG